MDNAYCRRVLDEVSTFPGAGGEDLPDSRLSLLRGPLFAEVLLNLGLTPDGAMEGQSALA